MVIREAKIEDLEEIRRLNKELFKHDFEFDKSLDCDWPDSEKAIEYFRKRIEAVDSLALVTEDEGKIVGYMIAAHEKTPSWMKQNIVIVEMENTFIEEEYRKRGIGTQMYEKLEKWAKENGANMVKVVANAYNEEGKGFYRKMGLIDTDITFQKEI